MVEAGIFDLTGKVALITGGGWGLGRVFCEAMAEFGADVACVDIDARTAQETVDTCKYYGHRAIPVIADVTKPEEVQKMVDKIVNEFGHLDIAFNNAGILNSSHRVHEMPIEDWDKLLAISLRGVFLCMRVEISNMLKQGAGSIINTSSIEGIVGSPPQLMSICHYCAAKGGVLGLTKQAALDYAKDGIRVNAILPGYHLPTGLGGEFTVDWPPERMGEIMEEICRITPMGRFGDPKEIKGLAVWLASDASSYATGGEYIQDGGLTAW